jgi:hypothetical protein
MVRWCSKVLALETDQGSGTTSRWKLIGAETAWWIYGGEGWGLVARGEAPSSSEAPGPAHEDGKWVRQFSTDSVAETVMRHSSGGLLDSDNRHWC